MYYDCGASCRPIFELSDFDRGEVRKLYGLTGSVSCPGFSQQSTYTGNCLQRPPGTICLGYSDGFTWLISEYSVTGRYSTTTCGVLDEAAIAVTNGIRTDYHHLWGTSLVKRTVVGN